MQTINRENLRRDTIDVSAMWLDRLALRRANRHRLRHKAAVVCAVLWFGVIKGVFASIAILPDITVADFEGPTYGPGWTTTGTAFGSGPAGGTLANQNPVSGFRGNGLVNSFLNGDASTGTLTSPPFTVERHYIRFMIGGGSQVSQESLNLLVNGTVVRVATGNDSEQLETAQWDVSQFIGHQAVVQMVDSGTGGWGHILVDDIVQTDRPMEPEGDPIVRSMTAILQAIPQAADDPTRPVYHFHAPAQWMNDPNGFIYYNGWYQIFYQYNPYGSQWGNMHWGHARSRDLVNWQHLPVALWPSHERGEQYVFSGSLFPDASGIPRAFYTSISGSVSPRDPEVWSAQPETADLIRWKKLADEPVISEQNHGDVHIDEWRDPYLLSDNGSTYLVTGGELNGQGVVCLYQALNGQLTSWKYRGVLFQYPNSSVRNLECPNLFRVGNHWVLLVSVNSHVEYFIGVANLEKCMFIWKTTGVLEQGSYASQVTSDAHNHAVEIAWVRPIGGQGWSGCLTMPNVLSVDSGGSLIGTPAAAVASLRGQKFELTDLPLTGSRDLSGEVSGDELELVVSIVPGTATAVGVRLRTSSDGRRSISLTYHPASHMLSIPGFADMMVPLNSSTGAVDLHVYLDKALLDVYGNGGTCVETGALSPTPEQTDLGVQVFAEGGTATIEKLTAYRLRPATFDLAAFH